MMEKLLQTHGANPPTPTAAAGAVSFGNLPPNTPMKNPAHYSKTMPRMGMAAPSPGAMTVASITANGTDTPAKAKASATPKPPKPAPPMTPTASSSSSAASSSAAPSSSSSAPASLPGSGSRSVEELQTDLFEARRDVSKLSAERDQLVHVVRRLQATCLALQQNAQRAAAASNAASSVPPPNVPFAMAPKESAALPRPVRGDVLPPSALRRDRGTFDRMVDWALSEGPNNRYALICQRCVMHNGLVQEADLPRPYVCAVCGFFNQPKTVPIPQANPVSADGSSQQLNPTGALLHANVASVSSMPPSSPPSDVHSPAPVIGTVKEEKLSPPSGPEGQTSSSSSSSSSPTLPANRLSPALEGEREGERGGDDSKHSGLRERKR